MKTALLVIDVQDSFKIDPSRWAKRSNHAFEENVTKLVATFREAGEPVIWVLHNDSDPGFRPGDPEVRLMSFLDRREGEPPLVKNTRNAFTSTDLQARLDALGVKHVTVCGISTEQCCETTTRVAADLGYEVDFVTEATLTFPDDGVGGAAERPQCARAAQAGRQATVRYRTPRSEPHTSIRVTH